MDAADGWTRVGGRRSKSRMKTMGNSQVIGHTLPVKGIHTGLKVAPFSNQLDIAEISAAAAVDDQPESSSAEMSSGPYVDHLHAKETHTMPGWYSDTNISGTDKVGRNRKRERRRVQRTAEEEVGRIVDKLEQARSMVQQSDFYRRFSDQWRDMNFISRLVPIPRSLSSRGATSLSAGVGVVKGYAPLEISSEIVKSEEVPCVPILDIVVYGVGSFSDSESSRCQLSLSFLLAHMIEGEGSGYQARVHVFDPVLTAIENAALESIGGHPIKVNEEGRRAVSAPTIFWMPHCEAHLYNNVLEANRETPGRLRQIAILGNSFEGYEERWSSRSNVGPTRPHTVLEHAVTRPSFGGCVPYPTFPGGPSCKFYLSWGSDLVFTSSELQKNAVEVHVDSAQFPVQSAFNDMSWHFFQEESQEL